jgi:hypothetical protein
MSDRKRSFPAKIVKKLIPGFDLYVPGFQKGAVHPYMGVLLSLSAISEIYLSNKYDYRNG